MSLKVKTLPLAVAQIIAGGAFSVMVIAPAMAQGLTGFAGGRPEPQPVIRLFSFLADKTDVRVTVSLGETTIDMPPFVSPHTTMKRIAPQTAEPVPASGE